MPALRAVIESRRRTSFPGGELSGREVSKVRKKKGGVKLRRRTESLASHKILQECSLEKHFAIFFLQKQE